MPEFVYYGTQELMKLIQLLPDLALDAGQPAMVEAVYFLHGQIPEYPPATPESSYKRRVSGGLGGSFTERVEVEQDAVFGQVGTNLASAPWVVGPDFPGEGRGFQAQIHVDRWWQFEDIINNAESDAWEVFEHSFWPEFRDRIMAASEKLGGNREKL